MVDKLEHNPLRHCKTDGVEGAGEVGPTLKERAAPADVEKARAVLDRVPDVPPTDGDER